MHIVCIYIYITVTPASKSVGNTPYEHHSRRIVLLILYSMVECMHPHATSGCTPRSNDVTSNIQSKLDLGLHVVLSPGMKMRAVLCVSSVCQTISVEPCINFRHSSSSLANFNLVFFCKRKRSVSIKQVVWVGGLELGASIFPVTSAHRDLQPHGTLDLEHFRSGSTAGQRVGMLKTENTAMNGRI